jgi:curli biogenesis system outer membrane secretion channel CsgG
MARLRIPAFLLLSLAAAGCVGATARVVDSGGQTVQQAQAEPYNGPKKRIAVSAFEYRAGQGSREIGNGMSDMLTDALFNSGRFIVLERERLDEVMEEQDRSNTNRFKKDTAAPKGELEGAELLIRGSVTQFEPNCKGGSVIVASGKEACMAINLRIVDAKTGRVVNATTVEGTSGKGSVGFIYARSELPIGLGAYRKTPMEAAIRNCIETAVHHIVESKL